MLFSPKVTFYAEVLIPLALPKNYTWSIPEHLEDKVLPGCRVEVNFGKNKKYAGIVKTVKHDKPIQFEPKEILNILDPEPVVFEQQIKLWEWMAAYYMCSEGEVMAASLPAHFKLSSETILVYNDEAGDEFSDLDNDEFVVAEALLLHKELKLQEVQDILDSSHVYPVINRLILKKICFVWEALKQTYSPKKETYILLDPQFENEEKLSELLNNPKAFGWARAPKQLELLLSYLHLLKTQGEVTRTELLKKSGASDAQLKGLAEKGVLRIEKRNVDRLSYLPREVKIDFTLTDAQEKAYDTLRKQMKEKQVTLLHGITSSGKTNLYIELIAEYIRQGRQVLYMLPEIALTSQVIRRLQIHFGGHIGIYHSKFSQNERVEIWNKVKTGELRVVLGARSSVFLPFTDLGLVICDEEHDSSFKQQDPAPRYHGRDAAIYLASLFENSKVVLGSGTPSIESYHHAHTGKYGFTELLQRYGDLVIPPLLMIDTRSIMQKDRSKVMLSAAIVDGIREVLANKRQVILFQNRRGYSPYQICNVCGWIPKCEHCDVSLNYHKLTNKLVCHYCGSTYPPLHTCAQCGNHHFMQKNFGTERIEELLFEYFPEARIARMDVDTVKGKNAHDVLIQQFEQQRIDILVGTQMVVKGLDFDHVDLVGILDADALLHFADFRVNERAFQLMEQVSGRAGRKQETGKVIVQTSQPEHPILKFVQAHDYKGMFSEELQKRRQFHYPPFTRLIKISFKHKLKPVVEAAASLYAGSLSTKYGHYIAGPAEPVINRIRNQFLMEMILKLPRDGNLIRQCKHDILEQVAALHQMKDFKSVTIIADVDPQ